MDLVVNDKYVDAAPSPEAVVALFEHQWTSALPGLPSGEVPLFSDERIEWAIDLAGGMTGKRVLELGPLEGGHTYMLEQAGAAEIHAIEANTLCYLRCLLVQQLFGLDRTTFQLGNFVPWLQTNQTRYDVVLAAGILYHLSDPVGVLDAICRSGDQVYLWTHYLDFEVMPRTDKRYKRWFIGEEEHEFRGRPYALHRRAYKKNPTNEREVHRWRAHHHGVDREADHPRRLRGARVRGPGRPRGHRQPQRAGGVLLRAEGVTRWPRPQPSRSRPVTAPSGSPARTG